MNLTHVSGIPTPQPGTLAGYMNAAGVFTVMRADGTTASLEIGNPGLSGLVDVVGTFASGKTIVKGTGTTFSSGVLGGLITPTLTIVSSGLIEVVDILGSGVIPNGGTPTDFTWTGWDNTYDSFEIRGVARGQQAGTSSGIGIQFNGDTTATNYYSQGIRSLSAGVLAFPEANSWTIALDQALTALDSDRGSVSPFHIMIPLPALTTGRKEVYTVAIGCANDSGSWVIPASYGVQWTGTAAITSIRVFGVEATTTFCSGTEMYLLGHKKIWAITSGIYGTAGIVNGRFV